MKIIKELYYVKSSDSTTIIYERFIHGKFKEFILDIKGRISDKKRVTQSELLDLIDDHERKGN